MTCGTRVCNSKVLSSGLNDKKKVESMSAVERFYFSTIIGIPTELRQDLSLTP